MDAESAEIEGLKAEIERLIRELREEREAFISRQLHDTAEIERLSNERRAVQRLRKEVGQGHDSGQ